MHLTVFTLIVKYVPEWFPGAGFKTFARIAKKNIDDSITPPFLYVKESFEARGPPSMPFIHVSYLLDRTSGGDSYHSIDCGDVFGGTTGTR